eukprot:15390332-Alexandrium_andersonii.AAC.1
MQEVSCRAYTSFLAPLILSVAIPALARVLSLPAGSCARSVLQLLAFWRSCSLLFVVVPAA